MINSVANINNNGDYTVDIFGVKINSTTKERVLIKIKEKLINRHKFLIVTPNPEILLLAKKDIFLKEIINKAYLSIPDGFGLKLMAGLDPIHGRVLFIDLLSYLNDIGGRVFLLGGKNPSLTTRAIGNLSSRFKNLSIDGVSGPIFTREGKPMTKEDAGYERDTIEKINNFKPDILFVGFRAPVQEKWSFLNYDKLVNCGIMVVGRTFEYYSGKYPLPPVFVDKLGLEWLWRLLTGSTNIKRIFNAVLVFPYEVIKSRLQKR